MRGSVEIQSLMDRQHTVFGVILPLLFSLLSPHASCPDTLSISYAIKDSSSMANSSTQFSTGYGPRTRIYFTGDRNDYAVWETRFMAYLYSLDPTIETAIMPKVEEVDDHADHVQKNKRAFSELVQVLDEKSLQLIMNDAKSDGRKSLKILRSHYASIEKPRILQLYEELTTIHMTGNEDVTDYLIRGEKAATGLRTAGEAISDNLLIAMFLKGLPADYKPFVILHSQTDQLKTLADFKAAVHNYENSEVNRNVNEVTMQANVTNQRYDRSQPCYSCGNAGHTSRQCQNKGRLHCSHCNRPGHVVSVCFKKQRYANDTGAPTRTDSAASSTHYSFAVTSATDINMTSDLLIDCGASCHIVNNKDCFTDFDDTFDASRHYIELADGTRTNTLATARGTARLEVTDAIGTTASFTLKSCLLAPSFPVSLFSVTAATDAGAKVHFDKNGGRLIRNHDSFEFLKRGKLYFLAGSRSNSTALYTRSLDEWHSVLGHMNYDDIQKLSTITDDMNITHIEKRTCKTCLEGKQPKNSKSSDEFVPHADAPLRRVHSDVCGPIDPISQGKHRYIINFVDEYSSMIFTYPLRTKDGATDALRQFLADTAPIGSVKELHTDNGGEYISHSFEQILVNNKIRHTTTAPDSSYQNGKSERAWRSLLDTTRCLISDAKLQKTIWTYALNQAVYLRNRSYQRRTGKTAYELFTGIKPNLRNVHRFGSTCMLFDPLHKTKLNPRSYHSIYLGYSPRSQGHFIMKSHSHKIVTSRNFRIIDSPSSTVADDTEQHRDHEHFTVPGPADIRPADIRPADIRPADIRPADIRPADIEVDPEPTRSRRPPSYLKDYYCSVNIDYACATLIDIPQTYEEAVASQDADKWKAAMDTEVNTLEQNTTWDITTLPEDREIVRGKWVYAVKQAPGENPKYKARYVAKGYSQLHGLDYDETFSPTTRFTSIRTLLHKAVNEDLIVHQLDVKGAYLNAPIDKEIYIEQPKGYRKSGETAPLACRLNKSLYGLKQSGRNWHETLTEHLRSQNFVANTVDPCVYMKNGQSGLTIILFWVDDIIVAAPDIESVNDVKAMLDQKFTMDDRGELKWFLGIEFARTTNGFSMSQEQYTDAVLSKYNMTDCNPVSTPAEPGLILNSYTGDQVDYPYRSLIGSLIYLNVGTRPDISWIVSKLSQYLTNPGPQHVAAAKRVLRYLKRTRDYKITFTPSSYDLVGYSDSDWAGDIDDRRSTSGYVFTLGTTTLSWKTRKQSTVALSTCEAEYMALVEATKEATYLRMLCKALQIPVREHSTVYCDNQSTISITKPDAKQHQRTKHIDVKYHFIRSQSELVYQHIASQDNLADMLTKPLAAPLFNKFRGTIYQHGQD